MVHLKSAREIEFLRAAAHLVGRTLAEVGKQIRPGVTTAELDRVAEDFIQSNGARSTFKGYDPGWGGGKFPGTICASVNDVVVHGLPSRYALQEGDLITVDCGLMLNGYCGDSAYTFAVGEISPENARLCRITYEALNKGVAQSIAGNRIGDIGYAVQHHCEQAGFGVVRQLVGHGIGRKMHEDPQVPNYGRRGDGRKLKDGMTFCIEPMINRGTHEVDTDSDGWTVRAGDGLPSAHYEHMVAVRGGKPDVLSTFEYIEAVVEAPYKEHMAYG